MSSEQPSSREQPDWSSQALELAQQSFAQHDAADTADDAVSPTDQWHSFSQVVSEIWESMNPGDSPMDHTDGARALSRTLIESLAGTRLGHYEIMEVVGHGGFGIVFRARDQRLQRDVAIKIPRPEWLTRAGSLQQSGDDEAAELAVSEGLTILEALDARAGPNDDRRCNIANGQMVPADILARTGRTAEARKLFRSSGRTLKAMYDKTPGTVHYAINISGWQELCPFQDLVQGVVGAE